MTKREILESRVCFKFYNSYYTTLNALPEDEKLPYLLAIIEKQFTGVDPSGLSVFSNLAYTSQKHNIESQVAGSLNHAKGKGIEIDTLTPPPSPSPSYQPLTPQPQPQPQLKLKPKLKPKEKEKKKPKGISNLSLSDFPKMQKEIFELWEFWVAYKWEQHKQEYKTPQSELIALRKFWKDYAGDFEKMKAAVENSIASLYKGIFAPDEKKKQFSKTDF